MLGPAFVSEVQRPENHAERRLVACLVQAFAQLGLLRETTPADQLALLNRVIPLGDRRLVMGSHLQYDAQLNPQGLVPVRYVRPGDMDVWAVFVGTRLSRSRGWKPGRPVTLTSQDMKDGVGLLFTELERRLALLDGTLLLPFLLAHYEALRFDYAQQVVSLIPRRLVYGERTKPINAHAEETSVALRFLAECVAAQPPVGTQAPSLLELDDLTALGVQLIHLGSVGDALQYGLGEVQAILGPNGALLAQANEFLLAQRELQRHAGEAMARIANAQRYEVVLEETHEEDMPFAEMMSALCEAFCGVRIEQFFLFINVALNIGDCFGGDVVQIARAEFLTKLKQETGDDLQTMEHLLDLLSLADRGGLLSVPAGVALSEVFPWQFNREFSLLRRPFVLLAHGPQQEVQWGNRALAASRSFWAEDQFVSGRLKVPAKGQPGHLEVAQALERIRTRRGVLFNDEVAKVVREAGFSVLINKKKFGSQEMMMDGNALGDIDVLGYDTERRQLVLFECKAYVPARTPQELHNQIEELIDGRRRPKGSRQRPLTERHLRRATWIRKNLQVVLSHLNLGEEAGWTVRVAYVMAGFPNAMLRARAPLPVLRADEVHDWLLGN